jgi:hypothetical protein
MRVGCVASSASPRVDNSLQSASDGGELQPRRTVHSAEPNDRPGRIEAVAEQSRFEVAARVSGCYTVRPFPPEPAEVLQKGEEAARYGGRSPCHGKILSVVLVDIWLR